MTTSEVQHWFMRCGKDVQEWLLSNPRSSLTAVALDAVIGAGGLPVQRSVTEDRQSEAYYLRPADSAYLTELRAADSAGNA